MKNYDIIITRIDNFQYSFKFSTKRGIKHIATALTFINPDPYAYSDRIEKFSKKKLTFKIGMLITLEEYIRVHNVSYQKTDYIFKIPDNVTIDSRMTGKYIHQKKAVEAFYKKRFGIIAVPTRGGKTFIASEIFRIFLENEKGNCLFITDNVTLFTQAINDITEYFENYGGIQVGKIRADSIDVSHRVTVATIQTIQSIFSGRSKDVKKKENFIKYFHELKFLCIDEIHDNCSNAKLKIYKKAKNLDYQLCLSATPYRKNTLVQNLKLKEWSGDVIYNISEKELRDKKVLSDYRVFMLMIDHNKKNYDVENEDYNGYCKKIIFENEFRNKILIQLINLIKDLNLKTLILFKNIEHGKLIEKESGISFISGESDGEERELAKNEFLEGKGKFLLASNIFKKGITLSEVEILINVDGGLEDANTIQKKGRVLGVTKEKKRSLIIDFFDLYNLYFSEHSETRLDTYIKSIGEKHVQIIDTSVEDWNKVLKKWIEKWFVKEKDYSSSL